MISRKLCGLSALFALLLIVSGRAPAQDLAKAFLTRPDIHGDQVVFTSEGDLWIGTVGSAQARRITTHAGTETYAKFSPDGKMLAFTGQYDGNTDAYVMDLQGGEPRRLTYEASGARVLGWTPDGKSVIYRSRRDSPENRNRFFAVPVAGGMPTALPVPYGEHASMSTDGRRLAYVPVSAEWQHWFSYQGGEADDIWLTDVSTKTFKKLTDNIGIDTTPTWAGANIYFVSERDGLANLYRLDPNSRKVTPATDYNDYAVSYPSSDGKRVVFEHGNGLALYDPAANKRQELPFVLGSDRIHARTRRVTVTFNSASLGPTGKRLLVEGRGQIFSVPVENGDTRQIARLPGSRSRSPIWSFDGKQIAFISDRSGEDQVWITPANGPGEPRQVTRERKGPISDLKWAPDGAHIAFRDREGRILLANVLTGAITTASSTKFVFTYDDTANADFQFSPDGKWLAYAERQPAYYRTVYLMEIATGRKVALTRPELASSSPAFDTTGKYLVFLSERQLDPIGGGVTRFFSFDKTTRVSLVTLATDTPSPFLPNNDEEGAPDKPKPETPKAAGALPVVRVDLDGIAQRIVDVPVPAGRYQKVAANESRILLLDGTVDPNLLTNSDPMSNQLIALDIKKKETSTVVPKLRDFDLSADGKKLAVYMTGQIAVTDASAASLPSSRVSLAGLAMDVEPVAEWRQIFQESWRIARDFFYDPAMHGVNWEAVRRKYEAQLPAVAHRSDLNRVIGDMLAELNVGHAYINGGDLTGGLRPQPMGYLGADLEPVPGANAFRITKILTGDEFDLSARSPLLEPGVNVKVGDYIVAVAGQPVRTDRDIQAMLIGTPGQPVSLTVNSRPTLDGSREVRIRPMASEALARYYDWAESRRAYVRKNGGENLGYVHIPNMSDRGLQEFSKHYYPNLMKDGMIYDVRNNGGGYISGMLLLQMSTQPYSFFKPRFGESFPRAEWAFAGYSAALCNENSGSNAEEFSDGFKRLKLGPVIGTRTWGGLVGSGNGYALIDGGVINIPNYGYWVPEGRWAVEGTGVQPDMEVEQDPAALMAGKDPQLDRAIAYLKDRIAKDPVKRPVAPHFPNKAPKPRKGQ